MNPIRYIADLILDFVYPPYCALCGEPLDDAKALACAACWEAMPLFQDQASIIGEMAEKLSEPIYVTDAISKWTFEKDFQFIIHRLKYQHHRKVAEMIGLRLADKLKDRTAIDLIIPVPLHPKRLRERGYNQSQLIGQTIARITAIPLNGDCLHRKRNTKSQTKLNIFERQENMNDAFYVADDESVRDKAVLLIDDVITTGSTINACARQLMAHGARSVIALSAAKA